MKILRQVILGGILLGLFSSAQAILPIQKLETFKGAKAYLVETRALPMVDIEVSIDAGDRYDPLGKSGLADMTAGLMKYGVRSDKAPLNEAQIDRKSTRLNSSHSQQSRMPSSA